MHSKKKHACCQVSYRADLLLELLFWQEEILIKDHEKLGKSIVKGIQQTLVFHALRLKFSNDSL